MLLNGLAVAREVSTPLNGVLPMFPGSYIPRVLYSPIGEYRTLFQTRGSYIPRFLQKGSYIPRLRYIPGNIGPFLEKRVLYSPQVGGLHRGTKDPFSKKRTYVPRKSFPAIPSLMFVYESKIERKKKTSVVFVFYYF